jgi:hypothetical protein
MKILGYVILFAVALGVAVKAYRSPLATFDRLLYAATVVHLHSSDPKEIAAQALQMAGTTDYPHTSFTDQLLAQPTLVSEQVPFYAIRPLYIEALAHLGLRAVSPLAYLGIVSVLLLWVRSPWWVIPLALLPDVIGIAREITPDALSTFVVLGGLLLVSRGYVRTGLVVLLVSLGVRTDNLFFLLPLLALLVLQQKLDWRVAVGGIALGIAVVVLIDHSAHSYGWSILIHHSFAGGLIHPAAANSPISSREYAGYLSHGITGMLSVCSLWALLGAITWRYSERARVFLVVAASFSLLHVLAFPISEPRYFATAFLLVAVLLVETFATPNQLTEAEI